MCCVEFRMERVTVGGFYSKRWPRTENITNQEKEWNFISAVLKCCLKLGNLLISGWGRGRFTPSWKITPYAQVYYLVYLSVLPLVLQISGAPTLLTCLNKLFTYRPFECLFCSHN